MPFKLKLYSRQKIMTHEKTHDPRKIPAHANETRDSQQLDYLMRDL